MSFSIPQDAFVGGPLAGSLSPPLLHEPGPDPFAGTVFAEALLGGEGCELLPGLLGDDAIHGGVGVDLDVVADRDGAAGQAYRLYQAAFDRAPDSAGLGFWMQSLDAGLQLAAVAQRFMDSPEFAARYGAPDTAQFVTQLYANVLHRAPDDAGLAYWHGHLDAGRLGRADALVHFSESPENQVALAGVIDSGMLYAF